MSAAAALLEHLAALIGRARLFEAPAERVVAEYFAAHPRLGARDRRLLADSLYALLRRWSRLAAFAASAPGPSGAARIEAGASGIGTSGTGTSDAGLDRRLAILAWAGDAAALDAVLDRTERDWRDERLAVDVATLPEPLRHNLPGWIAARMRDALGDAFWPWFESLDAPAPLDLRVNALKGSREQALAALRADGLEVEPTRHSPLGIRVGGKPSLHRSSVVRDGLVDVQDEGSQLVALAVGARRGETIVDFCAGAGGKTLALAAQMRNVGRVYAFDVSGGRLAALAPRLPASGATIVHTAQIGERADERLDRLAGKVDRVLVDAPCTGTGTLRRHPDLRWRLDEAELAALVVRQRAILERAARLVKRGGRLVYATCSVLAAENDDVAAAFGAAVGSSFERVGLLDALERARVADAAALVDGTDLRLLTHVHGTDGFYACAWRRR